MHRGMILCHKKQDWWREKMKKIRPPSTEFRSLVPKSAMFSYTSFICPPLEPPGYDTFTITRSKVEVINNSETKRWLSSCHVVEMLSQVHCTNWSSVKMSDSFIFTKELCRTWRVSRNYDALRHRFMVWRHSQLDGFYCDEVFISRKKKLSKLIRGYQKKANWR